MRWPERLKLLLRSLFSRQNLEAELDDELRDHLAREIDQNIQRGMSHAEAREAALRAIGPISLYKEECRDARASEPVHAMLRDFRYGLRTLRRTPVFTAVAIVTLALAIGANTTVFTFIENIVLQSLPFENAQQLVAVNWGDSPNLSYQNYLDFRNRNRVFSDLAAVRFMQNNISVLARENALSWGYEVSGNYFRMLGIQPFLGRFFGPTEDDKPNGHPVVVVSHRFWLSHLSSDRSTVGSTIKISGYPFTVIGVAPAGFGGTELLFNGEFWIPATMEAAVEPDDNWLAQRSANNIWVIGRLKPGVTNAQAEADLTSIANALHREHPKEIGPLTAIHLSKPGLVGTALRKPVSGFGLVLTVVAGLCLLLACINLASMMLARASDRSREVGIRLSLGATSLQLFRQFLAESALIAASGGALGLFLAYAACRAVSAISLSDSLPFRTTLAPNLHVLCFTLLLSLLTTLLFGLIPALQSSSRGLLDRLKNQAGSVRVGRLSLRDVFVAGQIALSVSLVICSVLVVRSLQHALSLNLGFDPKNCVTMSFDLRSRNYTAEGSRRFDAALIQKVSAVAGVRSVGIIDTLPLRPDHGNNAEVNRTDRPAAPVGHRLGTRVYNCSPGYLAAAGTRLLAGRDFSIEDHAGAPPVALVNEALVQALFKKEDPLGNRVRFTDNPADKGFQIVGIVETGQYDYLGEDPSPALFLPIAQHGTSWTTLVVRTPRPAREMVAALEKSALDLNPELSFTYEGSLEDQLSLPLFPARAAAVALGSFGIYAMLLAATGLFALLAYAVSRRAREIGIRMALGAKPRQVLITVLKRTLIICAAGLATGSLITLASARILSFVLYGISPRDPLTYLAALLIMLLVAFIAVLRPSLKAARIDPAITLREQ